MENNFKLSTGFTIFGMVLGIAINRIGAIDIGSFEFDIFMLIVTVCWILFNIYYCFGVFPKLLINYRMNNSDSQFNLSTEGGINLVSFCNGFSALIFGFLLNYNLNNNKVGYSCYVIGCLEVVVLIFTIIVIFV